jgi:hypothetical protein
MPGAPFCGASASRRSTIDSSAVGSATFPTLGSRTSGSRRRGRSAGSRPSAGSPTTRLAWPLRSCSWRSGPPVARVADDRTGDRCRDRDDRRPLVHHATRHGRRDRGREVTEPRRHPGTESGDARRLRPRPLRGGHGHDRCGGPPGRRGVDRNRCSACGAHRQTRRHPAPQRQTRCKPSPSPRANTALGAGLALLADTRRRPTVVL